MRDRSHLKKLGIIGGLGPAASARLYMQVTELTDAAIDQDHLDITILSRPQIPDRTAFILGRSDESYVPALHQAALQLVELGCEVICVPCNTSHYRCEDFLEGVDAQFVHMPRETARRLAQAGKRTVGVLATDGTVSVGVYQQALEEVGLAYVAPDAAHQKLVMEIIYDQVKAGLPANMETFDEICAHLAAQGCDSVILGCTELSVINAPAQSHGMLVADAMEVLAQQAIRACGAQLRA